MRLPAIKSLTYESSVGSEPFFPYKMTGDLLVAWKIGFARYEDRYCQVRHVTSPLKGENARVRAVLRLSKFPKIDRRSATVAASASEGEMKRRQNERTSNREPIRRLGAKAKVKYLLGRR